MHSHHHCTRVRSQTPTQMCADSADSQPSTSPRHTAPHSTRTQRCSRVPAGHRDASDSCANKCVTLTSASSPCTHTDSHRHKFSRGPCTHTHTHIHKPTRMRSHSTRAQTCVRIHILTHMRPHTPTSYSTRRANCLPPQPGARTELARGGMAPAPVPLRALELTPHQQR